MGEDAKISVLWNKYALEVDQCRYHEQQMGRITALVCGGAGAALAIWGQVFDSPGKAFGAILVSLMVGGLGVIGCIFCRIAARRYWLHYFYGVESRRLLDREIGDALDQIRTLGREEYVREFSREPKRDQTDRLRLWTITNAAVVALGVILLLRSL